MRKLVSIASGIIVGLIAASAVSLAQSVSPAGSGQQTNPEPGVRIFINDCLLTENAIRIRRVITPAAPSPVPIPYPNRKESDPIPFPLTGEIYIPVMDLAAALNGKNKLESHLKIEGDKLYARKHHGGVKYEDITVNVNSDGLISSALRELKGEGGRQETYLPLNDLVKALGGEVKQREAHQTLKEIFEITVSPGTTSLLSPVQKQ